MKITKLILILLTAVLAVCCVVNSLSAHAAGKGQGPTLECPEVLELSVSDPESALLQGVTAYDKQDGDLTGRILIQGISKFIEDDTARISYLVFDSDGNMATATCQIRYTDYQSPRFAITSPLTYSTNESVALLDRIRVTDCLDGNITGNVRVSSLVATDDSSIYTVDLQVTNSMGDTVYLTLPLIRQNATAATPVVYLSSYLVYLDKGTAFRAEDYLLSVTTAEGRGDKQQVEITGLVDVNEPGVYYVYYRYTQESLVGTAVLTVVIG